MEFCQEVLFTGFKLRQYKKCKKNLDIPYVFFLDAQGVEPSLISTSPSCCPRPNQDAGENQSSREILYLYVYFENVKYI